MLGSDHINTVIAEQGFFGLVLNTSQGIKPGAF